jgi:hypothetical protein
MDNGPKATLCAIRCDITMTVAGCPNAVHFVSGGDDDPILNPVTPVETSR